MPATNLIKYRIPMYLGTKPKVSKLPLYIPREET